MEKFNLKGKKVTVMGIGLHGGAIDTIEWLSKKGALVLATDKKNRQDLAVSLEKLRRLKNVKLVIGQHRFEDFQQADLIIKNPAIRWDNVYIQTALKRKIPVETDSSLFFRFCPTRKIIGVTGTKGKTTTSLMISKTLRLSGQEVVEVGIGQTPVLGKLEKIKKNSWVVFELSSWRLSALEKITTSPHIAVFTNFMQDHLNYYSSLKHYFDDKKNIFLFQKKGDFLVLNQAIESWLEGPEKIKSTLIYFSSETNPQKENKVFLDQGEIRFCFQGREGTICRLSELNLLGKHNYGNFLAAAAALLAAGLKKEEIKKGLINFSGVPHRLELVAKTAKEVAFFNDTAATIPEAAIAAINSLEQPILLIGGGSDKGLDLENLAQEISQNPKVKRVFLLKGDATSKLLKLIEKHGGEKKVEGVFEDFKKAVWSAHKLSEKGEAILLSPGCASFGMFQNEFERGNIFKQIVGEIAEKNF